MNIYAFEPHFDYNYDSGTYVGYVKLAWVTVYVSPTKWFDHSPSDAAENVSCLMVEFAELLRKKLSSES